MKANFQACLNFVLLPENDGQPCHCTAGDPGSWTSYGITRATWSRWLGHPASIADMQKLTPDKVYGVYRGFFWSTIAGDKLPIGLDLMVFDDGVLCGEEAAAITLQRVLGVKMDGEIGSITLGALNGLDMFALIDRLQVAQENYLRTLRTFRQFGKGWLARLARRTAAAKAMLPAA